MNKLLACLALSFAMLHAGCVDPSALTAACDGGQCPSCTSDTDCGGDRPRCDVTVLHCVACLPERDNCPAGQHCRFGADGYACGKVCTNDAECKNERCCGGFCTDIVTDKTSCGGCNVVCQPRFNAEPACVAARCAIACRAGFADCDGDSANGCEVDITSDSQNCGKCRTTCRARSNQRAMCAKGECMSTCQSGFSHCGGDVSLGCETNTASDLRNCGGCAVACGPLASATAVCSGGVCSVASCDNGFGDCNKTARDGCETNTSSNPNACGSCDNVCPGLPHAAPGCLGGFCNVGKCDATWGDCDFQIANGCETSLLVDARHCGMCGRSCSAPNANMACMGGLCVVASCQKGFSNCNGVPEDGCETNTSGDLNNCGACGNACSKLPHAEPGCMGGACGVGSCEIDWANCNFDNKDGCEADLNGVANCNSCGNACPAVQNGVAGCSKRVCGVASCNNGFADCNKLAGDGCEVSLATDVKNCAACGRGCLAQNGVPKCAGGVCAVDRCNAGYADCNGIAGDGCEVVIDSDPKNCGACANVCPANKPGCVKGVCTGGFPGSLLVTAPQGDQINTWAATPNQVWKLCYQRSRDGASSLTFHNKCNGLGPSITVVKLNNGSLFGGYLSASWNSVNDWIGDCTSFVFSLTNSFKHTPRLCQYYAFDSNGYGPTFGGGLDFSIDSNITGGSCDPGFTYKCRVGSYGSAQCRNDLCGGWTGWAVSELEVWVK